MAYYLTRKSVKLSYLALLTHQICTVQGRKVIIFCDWPSTLWLTKVLMLILGFTVISIRAKHKLKEQEEAVAAFNNPDNPVQVLVTSVKVSSVAISLQKDCSDVIFVDVPSNAQSTQQCGDRVIRIGQRRACNVYILTTDHSYDQTLQAIAARKMISVIAVYTSRTVSDEEVDTFAREHDGIEESKNFEPAAI